MVDSAAWPALDFEQWGPTKNTLQMCAQMLGKIRLALAPPQPEWLHGCLYLSAHGFSTGPMPVGTRVADAEIDVFRSMIVVRMSDGSDATVATGPDRCVADIWADLSAALSKLGISLDVWEKPQELTDTTPFSQNRHDCVLDAREAQAFHTVLSSIDGVFEEFRSEFFGRTSIQFWWGAFDFAVLLFSGKHEVAPDDQGYIMRYDLDAQHLNAGFWPGDATAPASFYAYLHPRPDGCETAPIAPSHAGWVEAMGEWMMPYEAVRSCDDPRKAIRDFLDSVYSAATTLGGWDALALRYTKPLPSKRAE
jgi:hypothetical protein